MLEKIGLRCEAHLREKKFFKGRRWDGLRYAILDHEWRAWATNRASFVP